MSKTRTPLISSLRKAFRLAVIAKKKGITDPKEIADIYEHNESRRRFIRQAALGSIALTSASSLLTGCSKIEDDIAAGNIAAKKTNNLKIAIIGGGMAGLNCAYQLAKAGIGSTIFEASDRHGGRIYTANNLLAQGITTELGGEFIDSGHEDMLTLADEFGLELIDTQDPSQSSLIKDAYFFNGQHYTLADVIGAFDPFAAAIQADIDSIGDEIGYAFPGNSNGFDAMSIADYFDSKGITGWLRSLLDVAYLTEYGLEVNQQSAINFLFLFSADTSAGSFDVFGESDERYKIRGGNQKLVDAIANEVEDQIKYNARLLQIKKTGNTYKVTVQEGSQTKQYNYNIVVIAIPFTMLRNVDLQIPLSAQKTMAINQLGYGTNAKLMAGFTDRHWATNLGYQGYVFTDQSLQLGWDSSQLQPGTAGGYTIFTGGNEGLAMGNGSAQSQLNNYMPGLNAIFPGIQSKFNGNVSRFHWPTHPFTMASYAAYRVGQWEAFAGAEGEQEENVYFCGEHTSIDYQGYMNGAAETGRFVAEAIAGTA
jgi:monoamine oxidase